MKYILTPILCTLLACNATATDVTSGALAQAALSDMLGCQREVQALLEDIISDCPESSNWSRCLE